MKIPAPMIPPMTAIVVPNSPSCRASPPPWPAELLAFSVLVVIESYLCLAPRDCPSSHSRWGVLYHRSFRPQNWAMGVYLFGREQYYLLLKSLNPTCEKRVVPGLPLSIDQKAFAVLELQKVWLSLSYARGLGVL